MKSRKKWIPGLAVVAALLLALYGGVQLIDAQERLYFRRGRAVDDALKMWARGLAQQDFSVLQDLYALDFRGARLGLLSPPLSHEEHGLITYTFLAEAADAEREAALQEWRRYLEGFQSIDSVQAHIVDFQQWQEDSALGASVRLRVVGRRGDPAVTVIDRMLMSLDFTAVQERVQITRMRLTSGERVTGQPLFEDVAGAAGLGADASPEDSEGDAAARASSADASSLGYPMARFWGAGISASDYDGDGWIDLFLPGDLPRLMRNDGRGRFIGVTRQAGLEGLGPLRLGLLADYDNDGHRDLLLVGDSTAGGAEGVRLWHNNGDGSFAEVTGRSGLDSGCCVTAAAWADYDNDGHLDLYLGRHLDPASQSPPAFYSRNGMPNQLWRNRGDGTFDEVASQAGVADQGLCLGVAWGDYDNDNRPDLWVVNNYGRNVLYRNLGRQGFADVSGQAGVLGFGSGHSAVLADFQDDGLLDLFSGRVLSPYAWYGKGPTVAAFMLSSMRQSPISEALSLIYQFTAEAGFEMGQVFTPRHHGELLLEAAPGPEEEAPAGFVDSTFSARLLDSGWIWGAAFGDLDADGDQDLFMAAGGRPGTSEPDIELDFLHAKVHRQGDFRSGLLFHPAHWDGRPWFGQDSAQLLLNDGDGTFREIGVPSGAAVSGPTRGVALADFTRSGRLDIAVSRLSGPPALLSNRIPFSDEEDDESRRDSSPNHWIVLDLVGTESSRDPVGARVTLTAGGRTWIREVQAGSGYASQNMPWLHFGLGKSDRIDEIRVRWPRSGMEQILNPLAVDRHYRVTEGNPQVEVF
ncbi:MAG TPA: CRTAC1 family protein [Acidobacteriota bacterium]|nr:CRTAC1 family protein [Acidobacteriota bacterium]